MKQAPQILASKYRTWNGKPPDETSGLRPQTKTLTCGRENHHRTKTIVNKILLEAPKRGVHSNMYSREQNYKKGKENLTMYKEVL